MAAGGPPAPFEDDVPIGGAADVFSWKDAAPRALEPAEVALDGESRYGAFSEERHEAYVFEVREARTIAVDFDWEFDTLRWGGAEPGLDQIRLGPDATSARADYPRIFVHGDYTTREAVVYVLHEAWILWQHE